MSVGRPWQLRGALVAVLASAALWSAAWSSEVSGARRSAKAIGSDCVPSIEAAQDLRDLLANANAKAATAWIASGARRDALWAEHEAAMSKVSERLVAAAQTMAWPDETRADVVRLADGTRAYSATVSAARERGYGDAALILSASAFLHGDLLPTAESLDRTNLSHLSREWDAARGRGHGFALASLVLALALAGAHAAAAWRFKRVLNAPLAAALAFVVAGSISVSGHVSDSVSDLRTAKEEAFDRANLLARARAGAADAYGEECLSLLVNATALESACDDSYEIRSFKAKLATLADARVTDALVAEARAGKKPAFAGFLGDELRTASFQGEPEAAAAALERLGKWERADDEARALEATKHHEEAVALCLSEEEGGIARAHREFLGSLAAAQRVCSGEFSASVGRAAGRLDGTCDLGLLAPLAVCALAWAGVRLRLRQYAA